MSTDPLYPSQVCFMMPDSSNNPRHEILGSFSWFSCYNADFRAVFVCFCTTFDLIFETRPNSLVNFCLLRLTLPFGGIYIDIKLVPPDRLLFGIKTDKIFHIYIMYIIMECKKGVLNRF